MTKHYAPNQLQIRSAVKGADRHDYYRRRRWPWLRLVDDPNDSEQTEDTVNAQRVRFVNAVIDRIADLHSIPGETIRLENLCPRHKVEALPSPTVQVCVQCAAEQKAKGQSG